MGEQAMASTAGSSAFNGFIAWWGEELAAMLPRRTRRSRGAQCPVIVIETEGVRLIDAERGKPRVASNGSAALPLPLMLDVLAGKAGGRPIEGPVGIRVPAAMCLRRRIDIPQAARENIAGMLAIDLERSSPFKPSEVLTGYDVADKPGQSGMLVARSYVLKRRSVEPVADAIESLGITVSHVEVVPENGGSPVRLKSAALLARPRPARSRPALLNLLLAVAALGLAAVAGYLYLDRHEKALAALEQSNLSLKAKAQARKASATKAEAELSSLASYARLRTEYVSRAAILEELTRILPDTAWVADLKIDGATLDITGQARSATALLPLIEASPYFVDATLSTSVTFDPREEKERFSIRARIRGPLPDQPAQQEGASP